MVTCGRCGKPAGIGGNRLRIFDSFMRDGQKMSIGTYLCNECENELRHWLNVGGYLENHCPPLPVRTTAMELVDLRSRLNSLIDKLEKERDN